MFKVDWDQKIISERAWKKVDRSVQKGYKSFCKRKKIPIFSFRDSIRVDIRNAIKQREEKKLKDKEELKKEKMDKFLDKVDQDFPIEYF